MPSAIDAKHQFGAFVHYFGEQEQPPASGSGRAMLHQPTPPSSHQPSLLLRSTSSIAICFVVLWQDGWNLRQLTGRWARGLANKSMIKRSGWTGL